MPVVEESKQGIFANPQYGEPTVEQQKAGLFANPSYGTSGLQPYAPEKPATTAPPDPEAARRQQAGLQFGGSQTPAAPPPTTTDNVKFSGGSAPGESDWRVRVSINPSSKILYYAESDPGIVGVLKNTDGFIFPYVPSVTVSHSANYGSVPLTHSNYQSFFYESSGVSAISITGDFTVQNKSEAEYFLAALYFFRACTKMFYGESQQYQGSPPPIVYLDGYGAHYLPHVPCVITSFSHNMSPEVDYMEVAVNRLGTPTATSAMTSGSASSGGVGINVNGTGKNATSASNPGSVVTQTTNTFHTRVPTSSQFSISLQPVYSRNAQRQFDYAAFARGDLISKNGSGGYL